MVEIKQLTLTRSFMMFYLKNPTEKMAKDFFSTDYKTKRTPDVDIVEEDSRYLLLFDLPGVSKKDINVSVEEGVLHISAKRSREH